MIQDTTFPQTATKIVSTDAHVRATSFTQRSNTVSFVATLFFTLAGRQPSAAEEAVLNALLVFVDPNGKGEVMDSLDVLQQVNEYSEDKEVAATWIVKKYQAEGRSIPGFSEPVDKDTDHRTQQLFYLARAEGLSLDYMNLALQIAHTLEEETLKKVVVHADGAVAALILTLGMQQNAAEILCDVARAAQSSREKTAEKQP